MANIFTNRKRLYRNNPDNDALFRNPPPVTLPLSGVRTGGGLTPRVGTPDVPTPKVTTGGTLSPSISVNTGGGLQPQVGTPTVNTGGVTPPKPVVVPPVNTGGPLPPTPVALPTGQFDPSILPALDGTQYVATGTGGGPTSGVGARIGGLADYFRYTGSNAANTANNFGQRFNYNPPSSTATVDRLSDQYTYSGGSPTDAIDQFAAQYGYTGGDITTAVTNFASQFAYSPGESPTSVAQRIASQFNTTPDQLPVEIVQSINQAFAAQQRDGASQVAMGALDDLLSREGSYISNARRRGLEQANSRGLLNSSIAAGASQRAALDAAQPIFSEIMGLTGQREAQDHNAMMQSRNQAFGLTSDREGRAFQRDMAGMQLAGSLESMDRQALIDQANASFALAGQLEGQERAAALAQAQQQMDLAGRMEMQNRDAGLSQSMQQFDLAGQLEGQDRDALLSQAMQQFDLAGRLEGQQRDAALAQARDAFNAAQQLAGQREQNAFAGQQAQIDRTQGVNNAILGSAISEREQTLQNYYSTEQMRLDAELRQQLQSDSVAQEDWLSDRQFTREFNGSLSMMAIGGAYDLNRAIMNYAAQNPEVYTPEIISGMTNFFQMNMTGLLQQYFPDLMGGGGT